MLPAQGAQRVLAAGVGGEFGALEEH
jgi:hypothetical protein